MQQAPAVDAPRRDVPTDSGRIEREVPTPEPAPETPAPQPQDSARSGEGSAPDYGSTSATPPEDNVSYGSADVGDFHVVKGQTLWGVATRLRPDSRLTMNQTMLAIYEANPDAFGGNINILKAGAFLRIPGADEVFQIDRSEALSEVQRQHSAWDGSARYSAGYTEPESSTGPSLTLVPPDEEPTGGAYDDSSMVETPSREEEIVSLISDLETADVPNQRSLIEIRDNELATLRQELANIRGEVYQPPPIEAVVEEPVVDEAPIDGSETESPFAPDDGVEDDVDGSLVEVETDTAVPTDVVAASSSEEKSIVDRILEFLTDWGIILGALIMVAGGLIWFVRRGDRGGDDEDSSQAWESLDSDEMDVGEIAETQSILAQTQAEDIVVVEQDSRATPAVTEVLGDTAEEPVLDFAPDSDSGGDSESFDSLEDTFSSETAVNLDQSDPIAEADFHMAYGLYDQAADLISAALQIDSGDQALLSKLCEIYFVWGNRDEFVDAASRLNTAIGDENSPDWNKIVIMGQQIAADHVLFSGAEMAGATKEVDLSFEDDDGDAGVLDMDFGEDHTSTAVDMDIGDDVTAEMHAATGSAPSFDEPSIGLHDVTSELAELDDTPDPAVSGGGLEGDATAEINLDELDLGVGDFSETEVAGSFDDLDDTGVNEAVSETGLHQSLVDQDTASGEASATEFIKGLGIAEVEDTGMRLAADETGQMQVLSDEAEQQSTDLEIDDSLLEETGLMQALSADSDGEAADVLGEETGLMPALSADSDGEAVDVLGDDDATMLAPSMGDSMSEQPLAQDAATMQAPLDDDADAFDFSRTENLPPETFTENLDLDATVETPAIAGTDVNLDLDDLTAALQVSEIGDPMAQMSDDATVDQPRPVIDDVAADAPTMQLAPDDMSADLNDARTMTEVGTKLDLARAYVDMGDPAGARSILEEVLDEGDDGQKQQAQQLLDSLPS